MQDIGSIINKTSTTIIIITTTTVTIIINNNFAHISFLTRNCALEVLFIKSYDLRQRVPYTEYLQCQATQTSEVIGN